MISIKNKINKWKVSWEDVLSHEIVHEEVIQTQRSKLKNIFIKKLVQKFDALQLSFNVYARAL